MSHPISQRVSTTILALWSLAVPICGESWERPRPVRPEVHSIDAKFDQVWAFYERPLGNGLTGSDTLEQITSDTLRKLHILRTLLAPSRDRYFYVQIIDPRESMGDYDSPPYLSLDYFPEAETKPIPPLEHQETVYQLLIRTLAGELVKTIPIERMYSCRFNEGRWLGNRWIMLRYTRRFGPLHTLYIDLEAGTKFLTHGVHTPLAATDGRHLLYLDRGAVFWNFRSVYPHYGEEALNMGSRESWEKFREQRYVAKQPYFWQRPEWKTHRVEQYELSPDGTSLVALDKDPNAERLPLLVRIDLEKIEATKDAKQYTHIFATMNDPEATLIRDDARSEFAVRGQSGQTLWRRSFAELAKP